MKRQTQIRRWAASIGIICALAILSSTAPQAHSQIVGQLGILDTSGTNPETGFQWATGDTYQLLFVTTGTTDATSALIADYNAFVQGDAASQTGTYANMGDVNWYALGSTTTTDAVDNVTITGPVINAFDSAVIADDAADMWDFQFTENRTDLAGNLQNIWTGSTGGGVADGADELGASDGNTRRHWSGWTDWVAANANDPSTDQLYMIGISETLTVVPEPSAALLIGLGGFLLMLLRRRG